MATRKINGNWLLWTGAAILLLIGIYAVRMVTRTRLPIRVAEATREDLDMRVATNGKVEPQVNFEAHAPFSGTVKAVYVHEGDEVPAGKLLLMLDDTEARARLATAISGLRSAQANYDAVTQGGTQEERMALAGDLSKARADRDQAQSDLATLQKLQATGAAAPSEVTAARQRLDAANSAVQLLEQRQHSRYAPVDLQRAQAQLADAHAGVQAAQAVVEQANVRAPVAGTVYSLKVSATEFVQAGDRLLQIADLSRVQVRAYFDEPEIGKLAVGQPIRVEWAALAGKTWQGRIIRVPSTIVDYGTRNVGEVLIAVDSSESELLPNTNVTVTVTVRSAPNVLSVPREALHTGGGRDYVYTVVNDKLRRAFVQVGAINLTQVQILSGLKEHDEVALGSTNGQPIINGAPVTIVR